MVKRISKLILSWQVSTADASHKWADMKGFEHKKQKHTKKTFRGHEARAFDEDIVLH